MPNCFGGLFSKPRIKRAESNRPPKTFVCGLLANCVDGPAGEKITEDFIRWYLKLSDDPQYDAEHSSWLATRPFNCTVAGDKEKGSYITLSSDPSIDCPPATAITTFLKRLQTIIECHIREHDTLYLVLIGLGSDSTKIFLPAVYPPVRDPREEPHRERFLLKLSQLANRSRCDTIDIFSLSFAETYKPRPTMVAEHPPSLHHNISFTGSFLTQPSPKEVDAALSDDSTQNVYNPKPFSDVVFPDDATIREYYEEIRRLRTSNRLWGYPFGHTLQRRLFLHASGQMNKEQGMRFCVVLMELDRQRVAHRRMAEDLGLWTAPAEGEVMSAHDKWMLPLFLHRKESPAIEMRALGLNSGQISMYTFTSPPYIDARMWLEHRWVLCGKPVISKKKWEAAADRASSSMRYVNVGVSFCLSN